jgi:hypothetical protein
MTNWERRFEVNWFRVRPTRPTTDGAQLPRPKHWTWKAHRGRRILHHRKDSLVNNDYSADIHRFTAEQRRGTARNP